MDFFEALTEKTLEKEQDRVGRSVYLYLSAGQIVPMHLEYFGDGMLLIDQNGEVHASYPFRFGCTDGEEVAVMVFRTK